MIAPFIGTMTMSELMAVMTGGFATVAGGVLAAYVGLLKDVFPDIAGHLIAASVMSAPGRARHRQGHVARDREVREPRWTTLEVDTPDVNVIDAAARGAFEGMKLALNVGAMLLAFIALIALTNALLGLPFRALQRLGWGSRVPPSWNRSRCSRSSDGSSGRSRSW